LKDKKEVIIYIIMLTTDLTQLDKSTFLRADEN